MNTKISFLSFLLHPFRYIAGGKSLLSGLGILLVLSFLSYPANIYFDGVLDIHLGNADRQNPFTVYAACVFFSWLITVPVFYLTALILTGKTVRIVDMAGTLALAKAPFIFITPLGFIPAVHRTPGMDVDKFIDINELTNFLQENILWIVILLFVFMIVIIWSVIWMYNAYSVSGNLKGNKGIVSFIIALFISEAATKAGLFLLL
jgi:hypothetical protein